jgi:L-histidine Nalpha-methyltransferase / hercynylcysteine S-oxide synthase
VTKPVLSSSRNLRKVSILLDAFEALSKPVEYYALDVSLSELKRTFDLVDTQKYQHVSFHGLHGTYDDGFAWITTADGRNGGTMCLMTLGSSIGNFTPEQATNFLATFTKVLNPADRALVGLDACNDATRILKAYNDSKHVTEQFYRNGLEHANRLLGSQIFNQADWAVEGSYVAASNKHHAAYVALVDIITDSFRVKAGDKVHFEDSHKYTKKNSDKLWTSAGLISQMAFANSAGDYHLHLLSPSKYAFPAKAAQYAADTIPSVSDWHSLWALWDTVSRAMVPRDELLEKPIKLRNNLIFYLGHIPAFAGMSLGKIRYGDTDDP